MITYIPRRQLAHLKGLLAPNKVVVLYGPRQCGKTPLRLLAFQIGKDVSCSELGTQLGMSKNTVNRYLDLLEKAFVIYRLSGFSRNLRKEIDLVEERGGTLFGYEFKWNRTKQKPPPDWLKTYDNARYEIITRENYLDFIQS